MYRSVEEHADADVIIMAAAVADYTAEPAASKIKKTGDDLVLSLHNTRDILAGLGASRREGQILVGFALETDNDIENARRKLEEKRLDLVAVNNPNDENAAFEHDTNRVRLLSRDGSVEDLGTHSKARIAGLILDRVQALRSNPRIPEAQGRPRP
jgi:phosphopantothenoylcysteine decarboxylase/phosphopantothenate--cysteine ligase